MKDTDQACGLIGKVVVIGGIVVVALLLAVAIALLCGCCRCPEPITILPAQYQNPSQAELRQEAREIQREAREINKEARETR